MEESCKGCVFLVDINCHPSNGDQKQFGWLEDPHKVGKGKIIDKLANGCLLPMEERLKAGYRGGFISYFDDDSNICEMHTSKDLFELTVVVKEKPKDYDI